MSAQYDRFESLVENGGKESPLQEFLETNLGILLQAFDAGSHFPTVFPDSGIIYLTALNKEEGECYVR